MFNRKVINGILAASLGTACLAMVACSGSTGGDDPSYENDTFSANESNSGGLRLVVKSSNLSVSQSSGFYVEVFDANGAPVPNINVTCDTENGLSLIEPTSGSELTDSFGTMSGVLGCAAEGSFQIGCRLPIGANARKFERVICSGPTPAGFSGFPNAGGGGLFGGSGTATDGDGEGGAVGLDGVVLRRVDFLSPSGAATSSVDTGQNICTPDDPSTPDEDETVCEGFGDTLVKFSVVNNTNQDAVLESYNYTVANANGSGSSYTSGNIFLNGTRVLANGGEVEVSALFAEAVSGTGACGSRLNFAGGTTAVSSDLGITSVTFRLNVSNEFGDSGVATVRASASFDNFDYCE